jgi:SAM-dependent methyltransferase
MSEAHLDSGDYYDQCWTGWSDMIRYSPAPMFRRSKAISWLKKIDFQSLIDIGCGNALFLNSCQNVFSNKQYSGIDVASDLITLNTKRFPTIDFYCYDIDKDIPSKQFDVVTCFEVIEHSKNWKKAILNLEKLTRKWLIISVPCGPVFEIDRYCGHTRHFSKHEIVHMFEMCNFKIRQIECWGAPFFNLYKHAINLFPEKICNNFLSEKKYTIWQKLLSLMIFLMFQTNFSNGGYQLFALAEKK